MTSGTTTRRTAEALEISERHVRRLLKSGQLQAAGSGNNRRITFESIEHYSSTRNMDIQVDMSFLCPPSSGHHGDALMNNDRDSSATFNRQFRCETTPELSPLNSNDSSNGVKSQLSKSANRHSLVLDSSVRNCPKPLARLANLEVASRCSLSLGLAIVDQPRKPVRPAQPRFHRYIPSDRMRTLDSPRRNRATAPVERLGCHGPNLA